MTAAILWFALVFVGGVLVGMAIGSAPYKRLSKQQDQYDRERKIHAEFGSN